MKWNDIKKHIIIFSSKWEIDKMYTLFSYSYRLYLKIDPILILERVLVIIILY